MDGVYVGSRVVWGGVVSLYGEAGSLPVHSHARIVELGHMDGDGPTFRVEIQSRDALENLSWIGSIDLSAISGAFTEYIVELRRGLAEREK